VNTISFLRGARYFDCQIMRIQTKPAHTVRIAGGQMRAAQHQTPASSLVLLTSSFGSNPTYGMDCLKRLD